MRRCQHPALRLGRPRFEDAKRQPVAKHYSLWGGKAAPMLILSSVIHPSSYSHSKATSMHCCLPSGKTLQSFACCSPLFPSKVKRSFAPPARTNSATDLCAGESFLGSMFEERPPDILQWRGGGGGWDGDAVGRRKKGLEFVVCRKLGADQCDARARRMILVGRLRATEWLQVFSGVNVSQAGRRRGDLSERAPVELLKSGDAGEPKNWLLRHVRRDDTTKTYARHSYELVG